MLVLYGTMIDGISDQALEHAMVVVEEDRILYAGQEGSYPVPEGTQSVRIEDAFILPGWIDAHIHMSGGESRNRCGDTRDDLLLTAMKDYTELVDSGITGIRDMSAFGIALKRAGEKGILTGPAIFPGGRVLSVTAGHCDFDTVITPEEANKRDVTGYIMDGVEGCLKGVRLQFREGAEFIKICATGGVSSAVDNVNDIQFSNGELRVIVEEAERHGTYVAAHCTGTAGTLQALKAGIGCVEHGVMLDEECIELMVKNNVPLVTTLTVALGLADMKNLPEFMMRKAVSIKESAMKSFEMARKAGIRVALGTDYSNSVNTPFSGIGKEFYSLTRCGYTPMEAIKAGTMNGAYLMKRDHETGSITAGKKADLMVVKGNPLKNIKVLSDAVNVKLVLINGKICKNTEET